MNDRHRILEEDLFMPAMTRTSTGCARGVVITLLGVGTMIATCSPGGTETYVVTKAEDSNDGSCGPDCSLREAIIAANENVSTVPDRIDLFDGTMHLSIAGAGEDVCATGDLDIRDPVKIVGLGMESSIIDASGLGDRAIDIQVSAQLVELEQLTVRGGSSANDAGGIFGTNDVVLKTVAVTDNQAASAGGGIRFANGDLTIQAGSIISRNQAGPNNSGGGISSWHTVLTITDSTISGNVAGGGGGLGVDDGSLNGCTVSGNRSLGFDGGGLQIEGTSTVFEIVNSTIDGNVSGRVGGGVYIAATGALSLHSTTLTGNTASGPGDALLSYGQLETTGSLFGGDCGGSGSVLSNGGNLESPGSSCNLTGTGDQMNVPDLLLNPLSHWGGPTSTRLPRIGSPAIGGGLDGDCQPGDQRGHPRTDGSCDAGSVERQPGDTDPLFFDGFESGDTGGW